MKINSKINKRVNESLAECRRVLTEATIELLKTIGAEEGQDVVFDNPLVLSNGDKKNITLTVADRIAYAGRGEEQYFIILLDSDAAGSSVFLPLSHMQTIYNEVRKIVRNY